MSPAAEDEDFTHSSGRAICPVCGRILYDHAYVPGVLDWRGHPFLHRSCDKRIHKL